MLSPAQYSLTVQNRGLKHHSFHFIIPVHLTCVLQSLETENSHMALLFHAIMRSCETNYQTLHFIASTDYHTTALDDKYTAITVVRVANIPCNKDLIQQTLVIMILHVKGDINIARQWIYHISIQSGWFKPGFGDSNFIYEQ